MHKTCTVCGVPKPLEAYAAQLTRGEQYLNSTIDEFAEQWANAGRDQNL